MSEKSKTSVLSAGLIYGLILGAVSVIISVIFYVLGKTMSDLEKYVSISVMVILLVYFLYMFRQERGGVAKYGDLVALAAIMSAVAGIITAVYYFALVKFIDPSIQNLVDEKSLEKMMEQLAKRDIYPSQSDLDDMMEKTKMFRGPVFISIVSVFNMAFMGTIISLIAAIFLKKNPKDPFASVE